MTVVVTDYDWPQITLDAIQEAIKSTQASPAINALGTEYTVSHRKKGTTNFSLFATANALPLAGWRFLRSVGPVPHALGRFRTEVEAEFKVARQGFEDTDNAANPAAQDAARDMARVQQAIARQPSASGLSYGPFGCKNTSVVTGQGSGALYGALQPRFDTSDPYRETTPGHIDNLGPLVWVVKMKITIPFIHS